MKILQITNSFYPVVGGQENLVLETSKKLVEEGHDVTVLTSDYLFDKNKEIQKTEKYLGIKIVRLKNKYWLGGYGYVPEMKEWLEKNYSNYEVVHCNGFNRYMAENAIRMLHKKRPIVFSPMGFVHTKKNLFFKKVHDLIFGRVINKAHICTMLTELDRGDYKRLGVNGEKLVEIPGGVDCKEYKKINKKDLLNFKKKYGLGETTILAVSRIHESKGLQYVVECLKDIDCKFMIVGKDQGFEKELRTLVRDLGVEKKVIFAGSLDDEQKVVAYHTSNVFVLFSEWEGFGIVVIEAMAAGKPVIVSDRGSLPLLVENEKDGFVVPFIDKKILEEKIRFLMENSKIAKKMGQAGITKSKKYDWKNVSKLCVKAYNEAIKKFYE